MNRRCVSLIKFIMSLFLPYRNPLMLILFLFWNIPSVYSQSLAIHEKLTHTVNKIKAQEFSLQWSRLQKTASTLMNKKTIRSKEIQILLEQVDFLQNTGNEKNIQDTWQTITPKKLQKLATSLFTLGLPRLAATLLNQWDKNKKSKHTPEEIYKLHILSLSATSDYENAYTVVKKLLQNTKDSTETKESTLRELLHWSILARNYKHARDLSHKLANASKREMSLQLVGSLKNNEKELWSLDWTAGPPSSYNSNILRATLLHSADKSREAIEELQELMEQLSSDTSLIETYYWAVLRQAQILLTQDWKTAQKNAEDVSYIAQEKGWLKLEYFATILDGWGHYRLKNYYKALICFTKARNMLPAHTAKKTHIAISQHLGMLLTRLQIAKKRNRQKRIYKKIEKTIYNKVFDTPFAFFAYWIPFQRNFYMQNIISHQHAHQQNNLALATLHRYQRYKKNHFINDYTQKDFKQSNPGGLSGLSDFRFQYRFLETVNDNWQEQKASYILKQIATLKLHPKLKYLSSHSSEKSIYEKQRNHITLQISISLVSPLTMSNMSIYITHNVINEKAKLKLVFV